MKNEVLQKRQFELDPESQHELARYIARLVIFKRTFKVVFLGTAVIVSSVENAQEKQNEKRTLIFKNSDLEKRRVYFWRAREGKTYTYFWEYDKHTNWNFYAYVEGELPTLTPDEYFIFPDRPVESESIFEEELWKILLFRKLLRKKQEKKT